MSGKRKVDEESEEEFDDSEEETKITKKSKSVAEKNGEFVFDLGSKKRVTVSKFKGKTLVNIREFYEVKNTGEMKPGKVGIALNVDQWRSLISQVEEIDEAIDANE